MIKKMVLLLPFLLISCGIEGLYVHKDDIYIEVSNNTPFKFKFVPSSDRGVGNGSYSNDDGSISVIQEVVWANEYDTHKRLLESNVTEHEVEELRIDIYDVTDADQEIPFGHFIITYISSNEEITSVIFYSEVTRRRYLMKADNVRYDVFKSFAWKGDDIHVAAMLISPGVLFFESMVSVKRGQLSIALEKKPIAKNKDAENSLSILSYNTYRVVTQIWSFRTLHMPSYLSGYDVVCLQEVFFDPDVSGFSESMSDEGYPYHLLPTGSEDVFRTNGLACYSKYPITRLDGGYFNNSRGTDALARKGWFLFSITKNDKTVYIVNTHLQSSEGEAESNIRNQQIIQINNSIAEHAQNLHFPVILLGDLNMKVSEFNNGEGTDKYSYFEPINRGLVYTYDYQKNALVSEITRADYDYIVLHKQHQQYHVTTNILPIKEYVKVTSPDYSDHNAVEALFDFNRPAPPLEIAFKTWRRFDSDSRVGDLFIYDNPYSGEIEYFRLKKVNTWANFVLSGLSYYEFPTNQTSNEWWDYLPRIKLKVWNVFETWARIGDYFIGKDRFCTGNGQPFGLRFSLRYHKLKDVYSSGAYNFFPVCGDDNDHFENIGPKVWKENDDNATIGDLYDYYNISTRQMEHYRLKTLDSNGKYGPFPSVDPSGDFADAHNDYWERVILDIDQRSHEIRDGLYILSYGYPHQDQEYWYWDVDEDWYHRHRGR